MTLAGKLFLLSLLVSFSSSTITIVNPKGLQDKFKSIEYSLANFGNIPYGQTFYGTLAFSDPENGCSPIEEKSFVLLSFTLELDQNVPQTQKDEENEPSGDSNPAQKGSYNSPIYLIQRGGCSFVTKSRNAEDANGKVVIIYNNQEKQGVDDIILMDQSDHSGKGLMVSTVFITKDTGDLLIKHHQENPNDLIQIKIQFKRPQGKEKNKLRFWMSSMDKQSYEFLDNFYKHYQDLKIDQVQFEFNPHFITELEKDESKFDEHCISKGKYCPPELRIGGNDMHNKEVVLEDLRQLIIFKIDEALYWRYISNFNKNCVSPQRRDINVCSAESLKESETSAFLLQKIEQTFNKSFLSDKLPTNPEFYNEPNSILESEKSKQYAQSASILPTLIFNGVYFRGDITSESAIYEFICSAFDQKPPSCFDSYKDWINFTNSKISRNKGNDSSLTLILLVVLGVIIFMVIVLYCYRRILKREMSQDIGAQVNSAISNYFALNDTQSSNQKK